MLFLDIPLTGVKLSEHHFTFSHISDYTKNRSDGCGNFHSHSPFFRNNDTFFCFIDQPCQIITFIEQQKSTTITS